MSLELRKEVLAYLRSHHVINLSTLAKEGCWATALFYVNVDFTLYFFSEARTRHGQNLAVNPRVSATICEDYDDWSNIKGIQLTGEARTVSFAEKAEVTTLFSRKIKSLSTFISRNPMTILRAQAYKLDILELWYLDNQKGFSKRERLDV